MPTPSIAHAGTRLRPLAALCMAAACLLAACGGDSGDKGAQKPSVAESAYAGRLRQLCIQAALADAKAPRDAVVHYRAFASALGRLDAPGSLAPDLQRRLAIAKRAPATAAAVRSAYRADDNLDARLGLLDCMAPAGVSARGAYPQVRATRFARISADLNRICADNAARAGSARTLGGKGVDAAAAERLQRLVARVPPPSDGGPRYTAWTDSLKTVSNFFRLAAEAEGSKAKALNQQALRIAAASRRLAAGLGLADCAKAAAG